jgi:hypothetical protein
MRQIQANRLGLISQIYEDPIRVSYHQLKDSIAHLEISFAHVLMLLDIQPKIKRILGAFPLEEDL